MTAAIGHRRDIDGLRAVAIMPVLLYHAGVPYFSGGYIGVDVFFVISGFLIAGIIAREIDQEKFSILGFYERRARRILPALLVMIAVTLAGAALLYLPDDFARVPKSALMAIAFLSNVGFFMETGYFAGGADTMPLLHTWSLAVEEQFYFGFPILLMLIARFCANARRLTIFAVTLVSFAIALATQADGTGSAFYLLPARAWELLVGALLAVGAVAPVKRDWQRELIAFAGLIAVAAPVVLFDATTVFPGINAVFPVFGAAALIHCAPGTLVGRLLSKPLAVGIGLISYSLYLWHWPVIVFSEYALDTSLTGWLSVLAIAVSFAFAYLSWRFIEGPFRASNRYTQRTVFSASLGAMAVLCAAAIIMVTANGWPTRFSAETLRLASAGQDVSPVRDECMGMDVKINRPDCVLGDAVPPTAMVWGDSHGVEIAWALSKTMKANNTSLIQNTRGACPPIVGYDDPADPDCTAANKQIFDFLQSNPSVNTVYLAGFWAGGRYSSPENTTLLDNMIVSLTKTGRKIVLIGAVPPHDFEVPRYLANKSRFGGTLPVSEITTQSYRMKTAWISQHYPKWRALGVTIIDPDAVFCGAQTCAIATNNVPLYFDSHHLSLFGAQVLLAGHNVTQ